MLASLDAQPVVSTESASSEGASAIVPSSTSDGLPTDPAAELAWSRIVAPPSKGSGHVTLDMCAASGASHLIRDHAGALLIYRLWHNRRNREARHQQTPRTTAVLRRTQVSLGRLLPAHRSQRADPLSPDGRILGDARAETAKQVWRRLQGAVDQGRATARARSGTGAAHGGAKAAQYASRVRPHE